MKENSVFLGDCLDVMSDISDNYIDLILCDLPFGITACDWDKNIPLEKLWQHYKRIRKNNSAIVLFGKEPFCTHVRMSNINEYRYDLIWVKQQATNPFSAKTMPMPKHENIMVFYKNKPTYNPQMITGKKPYGGYFSKEKGIGEIYGKSISVHRDNKDENRYPTSILEFNNVRKAEHPVQKPIDLLSWIIKTYSNDNDIVLDNCMGVGSTCIAAVQNNRRYVGIEKEKKYFDVAERKLTDVKTT